MGLLKGPQDPVWKIAQALALYRSNCNNITHQMPDGHDPTALRSVVKAVRDLDSIFATLARPYERDGIDPWWALRLRKELHQLSRASHAMERSLPRPAARRIADLTGRLLRTGEALERAVLREEIRINRSAWEGFAGYREFHRALQRRQKAELHLPTDVYDYWQELMVGIDPEQPAQAKAMAEAYCLNRIPEQTWEIRYASRLPGRAKILLEQWGAFPDATTVGNMDELLGWRPTYYIAACLPRWKIVWTVKRT